MKVTLYTDMPFRECVGRLNSPAAGACFVSEYTAERGADGHARRYTFRLQTHRLTPREIYMEGILTPQGGGTKVEGRFPCSPRWIKWTLLALTGIAGVIGFIIHILFVNVSGPETTSIIAWITFPLLAMALIPILKGVEMVIYRGDARAMVRFLHETFQAPPLGRP